MTEDAGSSQQLQHNGLVAVVVVQGLLAGMRQSIRAAMAAMERPLESRGRALIGAVAAAVVELPEGQQQAAVVLVGQQTETEVTAQQTRAAVVVVQRMSGRCQEMRATVVLGYF